MQKELKEELKPSAGEMNLMNIIKNEIKNNNINDILIKLGYKNNLILAKAGLSELDFFVILLKKYIISLSYAKGFNNKSEMELLQLLLTSPIENSITYLMDNDIARINLINNYIKLISSNVSIDKDQEDMCMGLIKKINKAYEVKPKTKLLNNVYELTKVNCK